MRASWSPSGDVANECADAILKAQFAAERAEDAQHAAEIAAERAQTEKAIAAVSSLAERLDALAAERAKPWWRRLTGLKGVEAIGEGNLTRRAPRGEYPQS